MTANFQPSIRVAILDDHPIVMAGLTMALRDQPDLQVVYTETRSQSVLEGLGAHRAQVLVMDFELSSDEPDGIRMLSQIRRDFPELKILVYSSHDDPGTIATVLRWGAHGFLSKTERLEGMPDAIRSVYAGRRYLSSTFALRLMEASIVTPADVAQVDMSVPVSDLQWPLVQNARLSIKEREVIRCLLSGMTITAIARKFDRSVKTISTQKNTAYRKLGIGSDNELFKIAHRLSTI